MFSPSTYNVRIILTRKELCTMGERTTPQQFVSDDQIVDMYWQRNHDAIEETDQKYGQLLRNVAYNILYDTLDCEECQNDVYLRIWNAIPSARPTSFFAFIMQIMRRIAIDRYREKSSKKRIPSQLTISMEDLENSVSSGLSLEERYEAKELGKMISEYVATLTERQRYIFFDRYYMAEPVEKTASDLSISVQTVYREIEKIKQGLRRYLGEKGVRV